MKRLREKLAGVRIQRAIRTIRESALVLGSNLDDGCIEVHVHKDLSTIGFRRYEHQAPYIARAYLN